MMNVFKQWWTRQMGRHYGELETPVEQVVRASEMNSRGMTFTLYHAQGGFVLEWSNYDPHTDRRQNRLYIIRDDQDFAQQVAQCVTLESLRRPA
jgi:hypothetical protein